MYIPPNSQPKVSLTPLVAILSLLFLVGGMGFAMMGDRAVPLRGEFGDDVPMMFYWGGTIVAALFILAYVFTMGTRNPYAKRRYKAD